MQKRGTLMIVLEQDILGVEYTIALVSTRKAAGTRC